MKPSIENLWRRFGPLIAVLVVSTLAALVGRSATMVLQYDRAAIMGGQVWRLLTGNLVHLGWPHLAMNAAGMILIWLIFAGRILWREWLSVFIVSSLGVGIGLLVFNPTVNWYVGLSGTLHGLFVYGCIQHIRAGMRLEIVLLAGLTGKLLWEQINGAMPGSAEMAGGHVVVEAHLYGAIAGAVLGLAPLLRRTMQS